MNKLATQNPWSFRRAWSRVEHSAPTSSAHFPSLCTEQLRSGQIVSMAGSKLVQLLITKRTWGFKKNFQIAKCILEKIKVSMISLNIAPSYDRGVLTHNNSTVTQKDLITVTIPSGNRDFSCHIHIFSAFLLAHYRLRMLWCVPRPANELHCTYNRYSRWSVSSSVRCRLWWSQNFGIGKPWTLLCCSPWDGLLYICLFWLKFSCGSGWKTLIAITKGRMFFNLIIQQTFTWSPNSQMSTQCARPWARRKLWLLP